MCGGRSAGVVGVSGAGGWVAGNPTGLSHGDRVNRIALGLSFVGMCVVTTTVRAAGVNLGVSIERSLTPAESAVDNLANLADYYTDCGHLCEWTWAVPGRITCCRCWQGWKATTACSVCKDGLSNPQHPTKAGVV